MSGMKRDEGRHTDTLSAPFSHITYPAHAHSPNSQNNMITRYAEHDEGKEKREGQPRFCVCTRWAKELGRGI